MTATANGGSGNLSRGKLERTILVVERDDLVRELIADMLEGTGLTVIAEKECQSALDVAKSGAHQFDLLLAEANSSRTCLEELSGCLHGLYPRIELLYMSGSYEEGFGGLLGERPERRFLLKPFTRHVLLRKIKEVLR